jgi:serine/threonine protein kinase/TPR repeat protein
MREARAAAQLRHANVASVFHLGTSPDAFFYAMEFVDGETVESFIRRQGRIDPVVALRIVLQVSRALSAAAKHHLVHRDIKPANLMLVKEEDDFLVKVIDFGLAKSIKHEENDDLATLSMGGFVGTAHFASPEQLEEKEIDIRSDIYSLGVTLWYMLAGKAPFGGSLAQVMSQHLHKAPPLEQLQDLPACVRALVGHMIEKEPAKRPQSPGELRAEVEACLAQLRSVPAADEQDFPTVVEGSAAAPVPSSETKPAPAKPSWIGPIAVALVIALIGVGLSVFLWVRLTTKPRAVTKASPAPTATPAVVSQVATPSVTPVSPAVSQVPTPSVAPASPAPSLGKPAQLTREMLAAAEQAEAAQDWPKAIMAYVQLHRQFPDSDVPRTRLELLLSKLQSEAGGLKNESFDQLRGPLSEAAKLDVVSAMELLGESLRKRDPKASFAWLCSAAAHGRPHAMEEVGLRYSNGAGVERDFVKAAQWFEMARAAGDASAGTLMAECYLLGKGVTKNESKAISLLRDAVAAKDPRAMDQLANCYHKGIGVAQNDAEAFRLYNQAASWHYLDSAGNLGVLYLTSEATDLKKNVPARTQAAVKLFRDGAKENNAFCMYLYARCLEAGNGMPQDVTAATDWYRRAAEAGNRAAQDWCRQHQVGFEPEPTP